MHPSQHPNFPEFGDVTQAHHLFTRRSSLQHITPPHPHPPYGEYASVLVFACTLFIESNLHDAHGIAPKRVTSGGVHLCGLAPGQQEKHGSNGEPLVTLSNLSGPGFEPQTFCITSPTADCNHCFYFQEARCHFRKVRFHRSVSTQAVGSLLSKSAPKTRCPPTPLHTNPLTRVQTQWLAANTKPTLPCFPLL